MDRWCFLWSHAQALKQTVQFQPMKFLYWGSWESSQFSSQWCKVWISFSFVVNLKTCWTNSLYDSEYIAYFWFTHEMCCCLYCDVQNETTGVILCWLIVDLFKNRSLFWKGYQQMTNQQRDTTVIVFLLLAWTSSWTNSWVASLSKTQLCL